jgi:hypothetical protein
LVTAFDMVILLNLFYFRKILKKFNVDIAPMRTNDEVHFTLLVSSSEYPRDKPFLLTMFTYLK